MALLEVEDLVVRYGGIEAVSVLLYDLKNIIGQQGRFVTSLCIDIMVKQFCSG